MQNKISFKLNYFGIKALSWKDFTLLYRESGSIKKKFNVVCPSNNVIYMVLSITNQA